MKDTPNVPPYAQVLDEIQAAGYTGTELGPYGYLPLDIPKLREELASRGLTLLSAFTLVNLLDPQARPDVYAEALTTARVLSAMGCQQIVLSDALFVVENRAKRAGRIRPEDSLNSAQWDQFAANTDAFAKLCWEEYGLKTVIHPHVGGYLETPFELAAVLERTDPARVGLCFDMAHVAYGGGDPVAVLDQWRDRVWYMHVKECDSRVRQAVIGRGGDYFAGVKAGVFPALGQGTIDWQGIRRILTEINYQGWGIVEQDILPGMNVNPLTSAKANRAFLQKELGW